MVPALVAAAWGRADRCRGSPLQAGSTGSVVLQTGQFIFSLDLLSAPAVGQGTWNFSIDYLANNGVNDLFGIGWNYSQNYRLTQPISSEVALTTPENTEAVYTSAGGGQWSSSGNNSAATLVEVNAGTANDTFILTSKLPGL